VLCLVSFLCITDQLSYIIVVTFAVVQYKNVYEPACLHFYGVDILDPYTQYVYVKKMKNGSDSCTLLETALSLK